MYTGGGLYHPFRATTPRTFGSSTEAEGIEKGKEEVKSRNSKPENNLEETKSDKQVKLEPENISKVEPNTSTTNTTSDKTVLEQALDDASVERYTTEPSTSSPQEDSPGNGSVSFSRDQATGEETRPRVRLVITQDVDSCVSSSGHTKRSEVSDDSEAKDTEDTEVEKTDNTEVVPWSVESETSLPFTPQHQCPVWNAYSLRALSVCSVPSQIQSEEDQIVDRSKELSGNRHRPRIVITQMDDACRNPVHSSSDNTDDNQPIDDRTTTTLERETQTEPILETEGQNIVKGPLKSLTGDVGYSEAYRNIEFLPYNPLPEQLEEIIFPDRARPLAPYDDPFWPSKTECVELVSSLKGVQSNTGFTGTFLTPDARGAE